MACTYRPRGVRAIFIHGRSYSTAGARSPPKPVIVVKTMIGLAPQREQCDLFISDEYPRGATFRSVMGCGAKNGGKGLLQVAFITGREVPWDCALVDLSNPVSHIARERDMLERRLQQRGSSEIVAQVYCLWRATVESQGQKRLVGK